VEDQEIMHDSVVEVESRRAPYPAFHVKPQTAKCFTWNKALALAEGANAKPVHRSLAPADYAIQLQSYCLRKYADSARPRAAGGLRNASFK